MYVEEEAETVASGRRRLEEEKRGGERLNGAGELEYDEELN